MKRMLIFCATTFMMLAASVQIFADLARPPSPTKQGKIVLNTSLAIVPDGKASGARLQISKDSLRQLHAALADTPEDQSIARRIAGSSSRTIVAGVFLFMSLSLGGVWLARAGSRSHKAVAAVLIGTAVIGAVAIITRANAGPPPAYRWRGLPQNLSEGRSTQGSVDVEIVAEGNGIKLIVPVIPVAATSEKKPGEE